MAFLGDPFRLLRRLASRFRSGPLDDELREEIAQHIEHRRLQLIDEGMDPREAAYEARRMFGNPTVVRERTRDVWSLGWIETLGQDIRYALRLVRRSPSFTAFAVLSLATGIGSAIAVFDIADAVLFRPLPVTRPDELRAFRIDILLQGATKTVGGVPEAAVGDIQRADFADFVGFRLSEDVTVQGASGDTRLGRTEFVTGNYFEVLGLNPRAGRLLTSEDGDSTPIPLVLSERLSRALSVDRAIGQRIDLNGREAVVVGIVSGFDGLAADRPADLFAPLAAGRRVDPSQAQFAVTMVARLHPGVTTAAAEAKLGTLYRVAVPSMTRGAEVRTTLRDASRGIAAARELLEQPLRLGLALVSCLLLIACANTGGLLLSRFVTRQPEFGLRVAIGAGRWRLARQLAIESLVIAIAAATTGLVAGWLAAPILMRVLPQAGRDAAFELRFDARLVAFALVLAVVAALAATAASLARLWHADARFLMQGETRGGARRSRRLATGLIVAQVSCSLLLAVGAVSMGRTLANLRRVPLGFVTERLLLIDVNAAGLTTEEDIATYHAQLNERIASTPGVRGATMAQLGVLTSATTTGTVDVPGFVPATDEDRIAKVFFVGPRYFETLEMRMLAGVGIDATNTSGRQQVAVVNERFALLHFGSAAAAIGHVFNRDVRIVGVVADARYNTMRDEAAGRVIFVPYAGAHRVSMVHIARTQGDPTQAITAIRSAVASFDPRLRPKFSTGEQTVAAALAKERFFGAIAVVLATLAALLACAGLYAAVAYTVAQRRCEFALRLALGASRRNLWMLVLRDPMRTTLIGILLGAPAAYLTLRSTASLLFGVGAFDLATFFSCAGGLMVAGIAASAWAARRATQTDPAVALRQ